MTLWFGESEKAEDGNAVIDWVVLMTGVVLMTVSVVLTVTSNVDTITDNLMQPDTATEDIRPV